MSARATHLRDTFLLVACRADVGDPRYMTDDPFAVSCKSCKRTKRYRAAMERFEEEEPAELSRIGEEGRDAIERHRERGLVEIRIESADPEEIREKVARFFAERSYVPPQPSRVEEEYAARTDELRAKR